MNERITFICEFDKINLQKIKHYSKQINEKLCKVPFGKNVDNRVEVDTLPFHFTLSAWNIVDEEKVKTELSKIEFSMLKICVDNVEIMNGKENSYVLYFNIQENNELKMLQEKIYKVLPSEKYNPENFNLIEAKITDLTKDQFNHEIDYKYYQIINRQKILTDDTKKRYSILKSRLIKKLLKQVDEKVYSCKLCDKLVEKFHTDATVFIGKDNDIVLIGQAPANNGWRKNRKLWTDVNGKVLPNGVVLLKLFNFIDRDIFETTFLESVRCYPLERKKLKTCSNNCKNIMLEQL